MATLDSRSPGRDPPPIDGNIGVQAPKISVYEQTREERIRANLERMQKLGLKELSLNLNPLSRTKPKQQRKSYTKFSERPELSSPRRRSSRLQNVQPPSYSEGRKSKRDVLDDDEGANRRAGGSKPEVYTEDQVKRLGGTERTWTLFVDGYGKDGRRIYDPINGKTCHQCRQKTLGHRTHCSSCQRVQGQFCGDCLYMRYGEHVLEALEDPNWICPVCRGICNCSFCRQAKGFAPTGIMYRKISSLGYKSVAHYLMQAQRPETNVVANTSSAPLSEESAKRSIAFSDTEEAAPEEPCEIEHQQDTPAKQPHSEELKPGSETPVLNSEIKRLVWMEGEVDCDYSKFISATPPKSEGRIENKLKYEEEKDEMVTDLEAGQRRPSRRLDVSDDHYEVEITMVMEGKASGGTMMDQAAAPSPNSIGGRLRRRSGLGPSGGITINQAAAPSPDSIGARLLQRRRLGA
ncbi:unnamed protein product [Linum tenue]|uniref:Zinc-finger domain-containing protein n=1 Tax=Linum tenue TaxID=586396 RepID=A0AAV0RB12_9ROSI|nr:unnamed protein product [Linum tenue]